MNDRDKEQGKVWKDAVFLDVLRIWNRKWTKEWSEQALRWGTLSQDIIIKDRDATDIK